MKNKNLGHQAPIYYRANSFNSIEIKGDFAYCKSHNFVYNVEVEEEKLYNGLPCYHTDIRFKNTPFNFYENCYLHWTRWENISLKSCIRKVLNCKNIPKGTIVDFNKSWYFTKKKIDNSYRFKIKKENKLDVKFEINNLDYFKNFSTCKFSNELTLALRKNGFIVKVENENENFLSSMISNASVYTGKFIEPENETGEVAIAYGHGIKVGYSSNNNTLYGYSNGCDNILWDKYGEFNKWSEYNEISKNTNIDDILDILKSTN